MKPFEVLNFIVISLLIRRCFSQISDICNMCTCETKPNERNILYAECFHPPKFQKMIQLETTTSQPPDIYVSMDGMNLTSIQRYIKLENSYVKRFSLNNNKIKSVPSHIFKGFSDLISLSIVSNEIENITSESFRGLENLKSLNLSYNALKTFDTLYLYGLKELEILDLRGNLLFNFQSSASFTRMKLQFLDASENKLEKFPEQALKLFNDLKHLNLSNNQIKSIPSGGFKNQQVLETTDFSYNLLKDINYDAFPDYNALKKLNLYHNLISDTRFLLKLKDLIYLDLSYNSLTSLNTSLWSQNLLELHLGNNGLTSVDDILKGLPQLQVLNASWNQCNKIPNYINPNLKSLILDENAIVSLLPSRPEGNGSLTYLSLSDLPRLKTLQKDALKGLFSTNVSKEPCAKLVIKRTGLQFIEKDVLRNLNICELDLSWNELIEIPEDTFDWERLKKIDLQGNPWHCKCSMQWLLDKAVSKMYNSHQELLENLRCQTPKSLQGTRLVHWFNRSEPMLCSSGHLSEEESTLVTLTSSPAMIGLVTISGLIAIALVATGFYLQRKIIRRRRSRKNRRF